MGWSTYHRPAGQSDREHFQQELNAGSEILASTTIKNTFYAAVRKGDEVFALVILIQRTRGEYNFGAKWMDETVGPNEANCPTSILDMLTPLAADDTSYAADWRARCRANAAAKAAQPKVKKGDIVKFAHPLSFMDGTTLDTFEFIERSTFRPAQGYGRYSIPSWKTRAFELVIA
jgi:hypothetical protein